MILGDHGDQPQKENSVDKVGPLGSSSYESLDDAAALVPKAYKDDSKAKFTEDEVRL